MRAHRLQKLTVLLVVLCLCAIVLSIYVMRIQWKLRASDLFREYIMDPVPASVADVKADQPKTIGGYGYVFRFAVKRTDLELIRKSRPFREAQITSYMGGGSLYWDWKDVPSSGHIGEKGRAFSMYGTRLRAPPWYDLESWDSPETYVLVKDDKDGNTLENQVLVYNAELGQAYFIVFHYGGGRAPFFWR